MRKTELRFGIVFVCMLASFLLPATSHAQVVIYSTFGPGMSFANNGFIDPIPPPFDANIFCCREGAVSFVSNGDFTLSKIDMALSSNPDNILGDPPTNSQAVVQLLSDANGRPANVLESWMLSAVPDAGSNATVSLTPALSVKLSSGTRYWLAILPAADHDWVKWNNNSLSLIGPVLFGNDGLNWTSVSQELPAFDVQGNRAPGAASFGYVHRGIGQTIRLTVVAGPVTVPPGVPVEANLGFLDANGNAVGPTRTASLTPGQTVSLDFQPPVGAEVLPVVTPVPGTVAFNAPINASTEIFDNVTGFGQILVQGRNSLAPPAPLLPQGIAAVQSMRITVYSTASNPCSANLSFLNANGSAIGSTQLVNLSGGQSASLDLNADTLSLRIGQRMEVQPAVTAIPVVGTSAPETSVCPASVQVFDHITGRTETYQPGEINPGPTN